MAVKPEDIVGFIRKRRFPLGSEKGLQSSIEAALTGEGFAFSREHRLGDRDIPDFFFDAEGEGLAVEVKIKGGKRAIHAQCERYCMHDGVKALVLVTNVAMGFPPEINGKPCYVASLGVGWF